MGYVATPKFFGAKYISASHDRRSTASSYKPQHWNWEQTEITNPISTLRSVIDYIKRGSTVNLCMLDILTKLIIIVCLLN